jgi:hypothetical protein
MNAQQVAGSWRQFGGAFLDPKGVLPDQDTLGHSEFYAGLTPDALQPSGGIVPFRTGVGSGYVTAATGMTLYGVQVDGQIAYVQMRAWQASAGPSFEAAVASGGKFGYS